MKSEKARQGEVTSADPLALGEEIARLAHSYWEADNRPEGSDMGYWLRAET